MPKHPSPPHVPRLPARAWLARPQNPPLTPQTLAGLSFAGVHDSFWTHAGSIEQMNKILRDAFVDLHSQVRVGGGPEFACETRGGGRDSRHGSPQALGLQPHGPPMLLLAPHTPPPCSRCTHARPQPLLETLLEELQQTHPDIQFPPLPARGELNLEDVKQAAYFFS